MHNLNIPPEVIAIFFVFGSAFALVLGLLLSHPARDVELTRANRFAFSALVLGLVATMLLAVTAVIAGTFVGVLLPFAVYHHTNDWTLALATAIGGLGAAALGTLAAIPIGKFRRFAYGRLSVPEIWQPSA